MTVLQPRVVKPLKHERLAKAARYFRAQGFCWEDVFDRLGKNTKEGQQLVRDTFRRRAKPKRKLKTEANGKIYWNTPTYNSWQCMRGRCLNKNDVGYHNYGGRGIQICERWRDSFANFLEDMGERPEGTWLDRINNKTGHYEPGNCRWSTPTVQENNRRNTMMVEWEGERISVGDLARKLGMSRYTLKDRIKAWGIEEAVRTPVISPSVPDDETIGRAIAEYRSGGVTILDVATRFGINRETLRCRIRKAEAT